MRYWDASALVPLVRDEGVPALTFVCLDGRLAEAAEKEGLQIL